MAGGADPSAVLDIIGDYVPPDAESGIPARRIAEGVVHALEVGGYRIVRAGMVPRLDELKHTAEILQSLSPRLEKFTPGVATSVVTLKWLIELSTVTLGLDLDDVDETDGADS